MWLNQSVPFSQNQENQKENVQNNRMIHSKETPLSQIQPQKTRTFGKVLASNCFVSSNNNTRNYCGQKNNEKNSQQFQQKYNHQEQRILREHKEGTTSQSECYSKRSNDESFFEDDKENDFRHSHSSNVLSKKPPHHQQNIIQLSHNSAQKDQIQGEEHEKYHNQEEYLSSYQQQISRTDIEITHEEDADIIKNNVEFVQILKQCENNSQKNNNNSQHEEIVNEKKNSNEILQQVQEAQINNEIENTLNLSQINYQLLKNWQLSTVNPLDSLNLNSPIKISEFASPIFQYLLSHQDKYLCRDKKELQIQHQEINETMRCLLIDWLVEVAVKYALKESTLFMACQIIDIYLRLAFQDQTVIKREHFQQVGVAALFISAKIEEIYPPAAQDFSTICDGACSLQQLLQREVDICIKISFDFSFPTPFTFFMRYSALLKHSLNQYHQGLFVLYISQMHYDLSAIYVRPSILACCACFIAENQSESVWDEKISTLQIASRLHTSSEIKFVTGSVLKLIKLFKNPQLPFNAIRKKFSSEDFSRATQQVTGLIIN